MSIITLSRTMAKTTEEESVLTEYVDDVYNILFVNSLTHIDNEEHISCNSLSPDWL